MIKEYRAKWLEALRSGNYEQSRTTLQDDNGFCCLGVLIACHDHNTHGDYVPGTGKTFDEGEELSPAGKDYFGLKHDQATILMHMNDGTGQNIKGVSTPSKDHSFAEIADWIEMNL